MKVWLDAQGKPLRLEKIENDISHQLIEELMLLANELVARELCGAVNLLFTASTKNRIRIAC